MDVATSWVEKQMDNEAIKTDKFMLFLLGLQWIIASTLSAIAYNTFLLGFIGGGIMFLLPLLLFPYYKGTRAFRHLIALCMMTFSIIYIQQHLGRIEMHFHVFVAMAFLAFYKDSKPIITATLHTLSYHVLFTYLQLNQVTLGDMPLIVYNYGCGWDITALHALFAISEGLVISVMSIRQYRYKYSILASKHQIDTLYTDLKKQIFEKERLLHETEQLHKALEQTSIISRTDTKGKITYVNKKFCQISGYRRDELIGQPHNIVRHPDNPSSIFKEMWETIQDKKVFHSRLKNLKKNKEEYYVDVTIIPLMDEEKNIYEYLSVRDDITELVQTKDKLAREISKERFLANMSHELRTPLNAIIGFITLASKDNSNEKIKEYLDISLLNSEQLLFLLNDILDIAKMKSGKFSLDHAPFNLKTSLRNLTYSFTSQVSLNQLQMHDNIDELEDITLDGDWKRISQILTNLISNAIKFTPPQGEITLHCDYQEGSLICKVSDTGIGLSQEAQDRIFEAFEQADTSTTREYGGTGLGLSISSELTTMMEGSLDVSSIEGEGSTFTLTIPLNTLDIVSDAKHDKETEGEEKHLSGHVLVVEDNKTNQMLIKILLETDGLTCEIANDGLEAFSMYEEGRFDIIFMDENMPNLGGIDTMRKLRSHFTNLPPIVALTANTMKGDKERFLEAGMDEFIAKPINQEDLIAVLKKFLK